LAAWIGLSGMSAAAAQSDNSPPASRGENFSAKPAPNLFKDDCTGSGCHRGPQGLAKGTSQSGLAGFLREHYTNSRESAAALAAYLMKVPAGPAQPEPRTTRASAPARGAPPAEAPSGGPSSWFSQEPSGPAESRNPRQQQQQQQQRQQPPARAAARSGEDAEPAKPEPPKPAPPARGQRGRQQPTAAAAAPPPPAEPAPPPAPPPPQFDIFD
jgi:hypothetical protein